MIRNSSAITQNRVNHRRNGRRHSYYVSANFALNNFDIPYGCAPYGPMFSLMRPLIPVAHAHTHNYRLSSVVVMRYAAVGHFYTSPGTFLARIFRESARTTYSKMQLFSTETAYQRARLVYYSIW